MKKVLFLVLSVSLAAFLLSSCSDTAQVQETPDTTPTVKADGGDDIAVRAINNQVKGFAIDGFPGAKATLSKSEDLENMKRIVGLVKPIIEKIPDGYVMQITGHAADYPTPALQRSVSVARAKKIYNELKKAGVPADKMTYKGVGISEPREGYSLKDFAQRRVSFKAVKK
jgi:outer membrane protein OmpA-like peptidoglycan-associated protein